MKQPVRSGLGGLMGLTAVGLVSTLGWYLFLPDKEITVRIPQFATLLWLALLLLFVLGRWRANLLHESRLNEVQQVSEQHAASCCSELREALARNEGFYRQVLEDIPEMVCRWQADGRITYVNEAYCRYFGLSRDELLQGARLPAFHPGVSGVSFDSKPYRERPVVVVEFPVPQPDGTVWWQRWIDRALFDEQGEIREFQSIGEDITERKLAENETRRLLEENQLLARRALAIQEEERARLARELHDELGQTLTAVRADAECILRLNRDRDPGISNCAVAINEVAGQVYGTVREMMRRLRPVLLDDLGLRDALLELVQKWQGQHPEVEVVTTLQVVDPLPQQVELAAYRIVQEALTNITKHAEARRVEVTGRRNGGMLEVTVSDDGVGMDSAAQCQGYGLLGMRERALALDGRFELDAAPDRGVTIRTFLPLLGKDGNNEC